MSALSSSIRGVGASAAGTLAMDALLYRRYRGGGGRPRSSVGDLDGVGSWDGAPAPALVAKRVLETVTKHDVPSRYARTSTTSRTGVSVSPPGRPTGCARVAQAQRLVRAAVRGRGLGRRIRRPAGARRLPADRKYGLKTVEKDLSAHLVFGAATAATYRLLARSQVDR